MPAVRRTKESMRTKCASLRKADIDKVTKFTRNARIPQSTRALGLISSPRKFVSLWIRTMLSDISRKVMKRKII